MGSLVFSFPFKKNEGLIVSPQELLDLYFYGIPIRESHGHAISQETIRQFILSAQSELEKCLNIKMTRQIVTEDKDWFRNDWQQWGYIRTTYPVVEAISLNGFLGTQLQVQYPSEWLSTRKTSDGELYHRHIYLVPNSNAPQTSNTVIYQGILPNLGYFSAANIPNYWTMSYVTGFCKVPRDLLNTVGMLAALNLFAVMGDIILSPGVTSQSISIDGLSQNVSVNSGYASRIKGYLESIKTTLERLRNYYAGFTVSSF